MASTLKSERIVRNEFKQNRVLQIVTSSDQFVHETKLLFLVPIEFTENCQEFIPNDIKTKLDCDKLATEADGPGACISKPGEPTFFILFQVKISEICIFS